MRLHNWFGAGGMLVLAAAIASGQISIDQSYLPDGYQSVPYQGGGLTATSQFATDGSPLAWSIVPGSGALPTGLTLDPVSGSISGTPTAGGSASFTVKVSQSPPEAGTISATQAFTIYIVPTLVITTTSLPSGAPGVAYAPVTLEATGGYDALVYWSIVAGQLPSGLSLSPAGIISGTPTGAGLASFTIQAAQSAETAGPPPVATQMFTININSPLAITPAALPAGKVGLGYDQAFSAHGTTQGDIVAWVVGTGALPPGLSLSPDGILSGVPAAAGSYPFVISLLDRRVTGALDSASQAYTLLIIDASPLAIATGPSLHPGSVGIAYRQQMTATGGLPPYTWSISSGLLPDGVTLD